jgi:hypothetical protein
MIDWIVGNWSLIAIVGTLGLLGYFLWWKKRR